MTRSLVICEKPSQVKSIRAAIGSRFGQVLPAQGHILTLVEPEETRSEWKEWSADLLWPGKFYPKKPKPNTRHRLDAIKSALKGVDTVIIATDFDREGQLIGGEILDFLGFKGKVMRCIFNAEDPKSLKEAFAKLRPNSEFHGLYMAAQAREQADQTVNLSLTRTASVTLRKPGSKGAIGIGRVKSPVLGILCRRELEILDFKPQDLFEVDAENAAKNGNLTLTCNRMPVSLVRELASGDEELEDENSELGEDESALMAPEKTDGKIMKKEIAEGLRSHVEGTDLAMSVTAARKKQKPPQLFNLMAMQSAASTQFGWSGEKTLEVAQSLYSERTIITYPRSDSRYLPENDISNVTPLCGALLDLPAYQQHRQLLAAPNLRKGKDGHFSDKAREGSSHHAVVPNINTADQFARIVPVLNEDEARLFDLIVKQYLAALAPDFEYRQTNISASTSWKGHDWEFRASGRVPIILGWQEIFGKVSEKETENATRLPEVSDGETGKVTSASVRTVTTKPPARYTEGALLRAMGECWRLVPDPKLRQRLKAAKGIGTSATRGQVIEGLIRQGQVSRKKKSLVPSDGGLLLFKTLDRVCPNTVDPARTAMWETIFDAVEAGRLTAEDAVLKIIEDAKREIKAIVDTGGQMQIAIGKSSKPTPKMAAAAKSIADKKGIKLPAGCLRDSQVCRAFLDEQLGGQRHEGEGPRPPSNKQLAFAEQIARAANTALPDEAKGSAQVLSKWIDENREKMPQRPPSEKQIDLARRLAERKGIALPAEAETSMKACSTFIDTQMQRRGSGRRATPRPRRPVGAG